MNLRKAQDTFLKMSSKKKKRTPREKLAALKDSLKLGTLEHNDKTPVVRLRRKSNVDSPSPDQLKNVRSHVSRVRPASANYEGDSPQVSPRAPPSKKDVGSRIFLIKQRIRAQVEVEAFTYGFDVAYAEYSIRYDKVWAVIEILDPVQAYQLLRGIVRHAARIGTCVDTFHKTMKLLTKPNQMSMRKLMKRRLNTMLYMIKCVIIQSKTIQEILLDVGEVGSEEFRSPFQILVNKMDGVRKDLESICQRITHTSISNKETIEMSPYLKDALQSPHRKRYNDPTKLHLPPDTPKDKELHEEHDGTNPFDSSSYEDGPYTSSE